MDEQDTQLDTLQNSEQQQQEEKREKICISITEGCIRHYNEEPDIEEQFILRLPEVSNKIEIPFEIQLNQKDRNYKIPAKELYEALEYEAQEKHLEICVQKNLRDASVTLDGKRMDGRIMDLPTIIESYKMADESTFFKTADISQILICSEPVEDNSNNESICEIEKKSDVTRKNQYKFQDGLCPPLKNARKKRFRKIILEENFDPDVDRCVKLLLRADGAAESVRYEVINDETPNDDDRSSPSNIKENSNFASNSNEIDVFGETLSVSSTEDIVDRDSDDDSSDNDSDFDADIGNIENYDLEMLTEEQKDHLAQLKEIDWCLSNFDFRVSPPPAPPRGTSRGRGRGRPRNDCKLPKLKKDETTAQRSMAGRGGRGRPPKRLRGLL